MTVPLETGQPVRKGAAEALDLALGQASLALGALPSALITDIDGTISPIVARPQDARVAPRVSRALMQLAGALSLVAVVTAREAAVARRMVGVDGLTYVGNYGLQRSRPQAVSQVPLETLTISLRPLLSRFRCITLEHKGAGLAIHYRNCTDGPAVREAILSLCGPLASERELRVQEGKQVVELVPAWLPDKGTAVAALLSRHGIRGAVYLGDDLSDIAVFRALALRRDRDGLPSLSLAVIDAETDPVVADSADLHLGGVAEVEEFLVRLAGQHGEEGVRTNGG